MSTTDPFNLNRAARAAWNTKAEWWDDRIGAEGNSFHRSLIAPSAPASALILSRPSAATPNRRVDKPPRAAML
jgi:hypothetical protein